MTYENMTKEQLIEELIQLNTKVTELELNNIKKSRSLVSDKASPGHWFSTGSADLFVSKRTEKQTKDECLKYKFADLVDIPALQLLLNSFYEATGIPYGLHDENNNIISGIGWQDICTQFHRVCPKTECRCKLSDDYILSHLYDGPYIGYKCMNGLMDYGTPVIVEGQHIASIFLGQFLLEPPDEEFFRSQAKEYEFDEKAYIEALLRVPVIPEEQVNSIMKFYSQLGQVLASMGLERKRQLEAADHAYRKQQERLNLVWETSNDGFWDWNIETGKIYLSPRVVEMIGYPREEIELFIPALERFIHPDDIDAIFKDASEYITGLSPKYEVEYRMLTKSGEWKWILDHGQVAARNEKGKPIRIVGTKIDITTRKKAEAELLLSKKQFTAAFQCNPDLMAISTLSEGRYIEVNDSFTKRTGYQRDEVIGYTSEELGILADPEQRKMLVKHIQEHGNIRGFELVLKSKMNVKRTNASTEESFNINNKSKLLKEEIIGLYSAEPLNIDGEACLLEIITDITDLRHMEIEMTRLDRLNMVGEMAASIGHEIRNPMTTVRGYLQILMENEKYHQDKEYFDLMIDELDIANSIITEFLSLAKNDNIDLKPGSLNAIIMKSLPLIQANAISKGHSIRLELNDIPELHLDNKEIHQLILNMVNNGLESMDSSGKITIKTFIENNQVVLGIQDQGCGIDRKDLANIGTPFFTTKEQGTGLGLAVCYRIAGTHNAKIDIETGPAGTIFYIKFPIKTFPYCEC